jgi:hypothetical protein
MPLVDQCIPIDTFYLGCLLISAVVTGTAAFRSNQQLGFSVAPTARLFGQSKEDNKTEPAAALFWGDCQTYDDVSEHTNQVVFD